MQGLIIENISNLYKIEAEKEIYEANARGKFKKEEITPVVGDKVEIQILDKENKKRSELVAKSLVKYLQKTKEVNKFQALQLAK